MIPGVFMRVRVRCEPWCEEYEQRAGPEGGGDQCAVILSRGVLLSGYLLESF